MTVFGGERCIRIDVDRIDESLKPERLGVGKSLEAVRYFVPS
jgi:hypothetical protein